MFGAIGDTAYNIVLLLHIATAIVAFAPAFVHPVVATQAQSLDPAERARIIGFFAQNARRIYAPALLLSGLLGFGLQGLSDDVWELSQTWLLLSVLVWIAMNGILHAVVLPAERAVAAGEGESAEQRLMIGGITITVLLLVILYLMIWKPGL